jgi:hypothetical protein
MNSKTTLAFSLTVAIAIASLFVSYPILGNQQVFAANVGNVGHLYQGGLPGYPYFGGYPGYGGYPYITGYGGYPYHHLGDYPGYGGYPYHHHHHHHHH